MCGNRGARDNKHGTLRARPQMSPGRFQPQKQMISWRFARQLGAIITWSNEWPRWIDDIWQPYIRTSFGAMLKLSQVGERPTMDDLRSKGESMLRIIGAFSAC
ncbi:MAG: hypothetical protein AAB353_04875, partial [Candidatus Hydrogenedentota bacterium]